MATFITQQFKPSVQFLQLSVHCRFVINKPLWIQHLLSVRLSPHSLVSISSQVSTYRSIF